MHDGRRSKTEHFCDASRAIDASDIFVGGRSDSLAFSDVPIDDIEARGGR